MRNLRKFPTHVICFVTFVFLAALGKMGANSTVSFLSGTPGDTSLKIEMLNRLAG